MNRKFFALPYIFPLVYLLLAFGYILKMVEPVLHFHHLQPPFLLSRHFFAGYLGRPGGITELAANFFMQSFYYKHAGSLVFLVLAALVWLLVSALLNHICKSRFNVIWGAIPFTITIALANHPNFPFVVVVSLLLALLSLLFITRTGKTLPGASVSFVILAMLVYYLAGSGWLILFAVSALFFIPKEKIAIQAGTALAMLLFAFLLLKTAATFVFPVSPSQAWFYFFPWEPYFLAYKTGPAFYSLLLSIPLFLLIARVYARVNAKKTFTFFNNYETVKIYLGYALVLVTAFTAHKNCFDSDLKKRVEADYYCYNNNPRKTARAATTLKEYSFSANLNYNLVMAKTGRLNDEFFGFFQIRGSDALYPDIYFASEMSFIATDFYYDLGYMSEARHWAYESLVNFPYSLRAMQSLVKIHLVYREYEAARKYLDLLDKNLLASDFVSKYKPYLNDTMLIASDREFMQKRSFMPGEHELDPNIGNRFKELFEANPNNKRAYEYLMLFYLLNDDLTHFATLLNRAGNYFEKPVPIYEEALLMYRSNPVNRDSCNYPITPETRKRFENFKNEFNRAGGNSMRARNSLYPQFGNTYLYYRQLVYPILLEPEYIEKTNDGEPAI